MCKHFERAGTTTRTAATARRRPARVRRPRRGGRDHGACQMPGLQGTRMAGWAPASPVCRRSARPRPTPNPPAFLRRVIVNQREMHLRSQRGHPATPSTNSPRRPIRGRGHDRRPPAVGERAGGPARGGRARAADPAHHRMTPTEGVDDELARGALARRRDGRLGHHPPPVRALRRARHHGDQPHAGRLPRERLLPRGTRRDSPISPPAARPPRRLRLTDPTPVLACDQEAEREKAPAGRGLRDRRAL